VTTKSIILCIRSYRKEKETVSHTDRMTELTPAEIRRHTGTSDFSAAFFKKDGSDSSDLVMSWVHTRGRIQKGGSGDSGKDLVVMHDGVGRFPQVFLSGVEGISGGGAVFSPSGTSFVVQTKKALILVKTADLTISNSNWVSLEEGESFTGNPTWINEDRVLFGVSGGKPKRGRLFCTPPWKGIMLETVESDKRRGPLFTAEHGGAILSWDHSQKEIGEGGAQIAIVHRLANAMIAEVVVVADRGNNDDGTSSVASSSATVLAVDCRQEYCPPQVAFLSNGALLLRLNALLLENGEHLRRTQGVEELPKDTLRHGLWLINNLETPQLKPVDVMLGGHGTYDCCNGSYGRPGAVEGFKIDNTRTRVVVTARRTGTKTITYSDNLFQLQLGEEGTLEAKLVETEESGKGCKIAVAIGENSIVYHHRSPTETGDLWMSGFDLSPGKKARLTETMPLSLKCKLTTPTEVTIYNHANDLPIHAQIFKPAGEGPLQPLLWLHGGPMAQFSFDYNPLLVWLASCGYLVMAPNFSGSTGNDLAFMNRVLADGCGVTDLSDCLACANYLKTEAVTLEPRLDTSRGVAVGGHSWGGYLAFMCMLQQEQNGESVFGCGIAAAGITDWFVQQRHTEVRYYDYALMGGWVYKEEVAARAREVSPITKATELRAPILILHGEDDIDVPFQQIPKFVEAAKRSPHAGASVEYHSYKGEGHGMSGTEAQADYLNRVKTFLRVNLKPWDFTDNPHGEVTAY